MAKGTPIELADAAPTKQFFVSMLTRDIDLGDAILDLIDNCLDGALRAADGKAVDYSAHNVAITFDEGHFQIRDDCGGIPRKIAISYAFKIGRDSDDKRDESEETIGMYGVGMKRAIFKMGLEASVQSKHDSDSFEVAISSEWIKEKAWNKLPLKTISGSGLPKHGGTIIKVESLYRAVSKHFSSEVFESDLINSIGDHFTVFIERGLTIRVNDKPVKGKRIAVLACKDHDSPAPYVFRDIIDDVEISIVVGLNSGRTETREPADEEEAEDEETAFEADRSTETSGWTIFCNDRAVIVGDKSRLTGWGDGIPMFHAQFSIITGIIEFRSASSNKLPVTTTKRALDTASDVWLRARTKMREGVRVWISYTNAWKNNPRSDQSKYWRDALPFDLHDAVELVSLRIRKGKKSPLPDSFEYNPQKKGVLPSPKTQSPTHRRIIYSRPIEEIRTVSKFLFSDDETKPGIVGDECFSLALKQAKKAH